MLVNMMIIMIMISITSMSTIMTMAMIMIRHMSLVMITHMTMPPCRAGPHYKARGNCNGLWEKKLDKININIEQQVLRFGIHMWYRLSAE